MLIAAGLAGAALVFACLVATRAGTPHWFVAFQAGLRVVRRPSLLAWALLPAIVSWLVDLGCIVVVMRAVGLAVPVASGLLVLLAVNLAITVPVMPANLGTFELGVLGMLKPFGVSSELCLAFGLLYHMAQVLPVVGIALLDTRFAVSSQSVQKQASTQQ